MYPVCLAKPASCPVFPLRGSFCCLFCLFLSIKSPSPAPLSPRLIPLPNPDSHVCLVNLYLSLCSSLSLFTLLYLSIFLCLTKTLFILTHCLSFLFFCIFLLYISISISCQVTTKPIFQPCPSCQTPNQASRKSYVCFGSLSTKQNINDKVESLDSQWGQAVKKSRNVGCIIDSARIAVSKMKIVHKCYLKCN